jgi:hypothetical protein
MADGGGPGQSGDTFGGALGGISNAMGFSPMGSDGGYSGFGDMVDGGGRGRSGDTFSGGFFSENANMLGITPRGNVGGLPSAAGMNMTSFGGNGPGGDTPDLRRLVQQATVSLAAPTGDGLTGEEVSRRNAERSRVPTYEEGGMVGPGGKPKRPSTRQQKLPPILQGLLGGRQSYAEGGMVGPGGMPQRPMTSPMAMDVMQRGGAPVVGMAPPGGQGRPLNFAAIEQEAQRFMQQQPQQVAQIRAEAEKAIAAGELDAQALNLFVQVATAALQNPEMWPQLRQALINQDFIDPEDISEEFDQGFLITLYIVGKTVGGGVMAAPAPMSAGQAPQMSMREGGPLPAKSENPDGSIPINAHEGEYVVPADVARKLGTDYFDKMIAKARGMDGKGEQQ